MKVFISYTHKNMDTAKTLAQMLREHGHQVFLDADSIIAGDHIEDSIRNALRYSQVLVAIVTEDYLNSSWARAELSAAVLGTSEAVPVPVLVGNVLPPSFLMSVRYLSVKHIDDVAPVVLQRITELDNQLSKSKDKTDTPKQLQKTARVTSDVKEQDQILDDRIERLKGALASNRLTLVCGAGISAGSSIPNWNELLINILNDTLGKQKSSNSDSPLTAEGLLSNLKQSNIILGKYLKLLLKDKFEEMVQKHLYLKYEVERDSESTVGHENTYYVLTTDMMRAIVDLSRPKRRGSYLESIISFNFDDLIERALSAHSIEHTSIWKEGQIHEVDSLPIFHVHGYLPSNKTLDEPNLVFSEEAYHTQFIDPYSWSNLVQLNAFSSNVCLFVGLSLSDPNLRRLLDISFRRNQRLNHYIIKRTLQSKKQANKKSDEIANMLFELDANSLGLNVIWCSEYSDIPEILHRIAK